MPVPLDDGQRLVAEHELVALVGRVAEDAFGDLAVGPAHADLEHAEQHAVAGRFWDVADTRRVRCARRGEERLHNLVR